MLKDKTTWLLIILILAIAIIGGLDNKKTVNEVKNGQYITNGLTE